MATNINLKDQITPVTWNPLSPLKNQSGTALAMGAGGCVVSDFRCGTNREDKLWILQATTGLYRYDLKNQGANILTSPALPALAAGSCSVFAPSHGPRGTIAAGATTTSVTLSTALPLAVGINQLVGETIRIVTNQAGQGRTEERTIVANTSGTTPVITVNAAFAAAPATSSIYEIHSGRLYMLASGALAASSFRYYDLATEAVADRSNTNLAGTIGTDSTAICLDELHVPINANGANQNGASGLGYFGQLTATGIAATTLTGQAAGGDASVLANEYRNFQIRIVEDLTNPTAVGQRRRITSHTAGTSPVYTVPTWSVTPSSTAKYVIENNNDIILWTTANTTTYRYEWVGNAWDTSTYAVRPSASGAGVQAYHLYNNTIDAAKVARYSQILSWRGAATADLDIFDISGATTGSWSGNVAYGNKGALNTVSTGGCGIYNPIDNEILFIATTTASVPPMMLKLSASPLKIEGFREPQALEGSAVVGARLGFGLFIDGSTKQGIAYKFPCTTAGLPIYQCLIN